MKRDREDAVAEGEADEAAKRSRLEADQSGASNGAAGAGAAADQPPAEEEDEDFIALPRSCTRSVVKKGQECPYLDTISRQVRGSVGY